MVRIKLLTSPPESLVLMDNFEFAEIYLGSQVITAARIKLERTVGRKVYGRILPLHLVVSLACYH